MHINRALGYTVLTITTIGISQVIGVCGLFFTACKAVYDHIQYQRYSSLFKQATETPSAPERLSHAENMREHYKLRKQDNLIYAKAFSASLISLSLNHGLGYMEKSFAAMISDVVLGLFSGEAIRQKIFALNGQQNYVPDSQDPDDINPKIIRESMLKEWKEAEEVRIPADENLHRSFDALWIPCDNNPADRPTVIVIPGRASVLEHNKIYAEYYRKKGLNVLLYSPSGYPGSLPRDFKTTELSLYQDADAAMRFVKQRCGATYPNERVAFHGVSAGAASAIDAASHYKGSHVIADIPFSSGVEAGERYLKNSSLRLIFTSIVAKRLAKDLARAAFGASTERMIGRFQLNCFNNKEKIKSVSGKVFLIYGTKDTIMSYLKTERKRRNLALRLEECSNNFHGSVEFEGGHKAGLKHPEVEKPLNEYLSTIGFDRMKLKLRNDATDTPERCAGL